MTEQRQREQALKDLTEQLEQRVLARTSELQQREAELAQEKGRLELVLSTIPVGISLFDSNLNLELSNQQLQDIMRFPSELCQPGMPFERFIRHNAERGEYGVGDVEPQIRSRVEIAWERKPHRFERVRPDGSAVEVIGCPTITGGFVTTYLDVTDRIRTEAALRASESRFRDFAQSSSDWYFETDAELCMRYLSSHFFDAIGLQPEFILGKKREQIVGSDAMVSDPEKWRLHQEALLRREPYRDLEYPLRSGDGSWRHVRVNGVPAFDADGQFLGYRGTGKDITQAKEAALRLSSSEAQLRAILEASPIGVAVVDSENDTVLFCNPRLAEQLGQTPGQLMGRSAGSFFVDDGPGFLPLGKPPGDTPAGDSERQLQRADGSSWRALVSIKPLIYLGKSCLLIWAYDISELHEAREQLDRLAHHDALTGLPNRRYFDIAAERAITRAKRFNTRGLVFYFDLDGFKLVNDSLGHAMGDQMLQKIATNLRARCRESDLVARLGGDEFAVLVEDCSGHQEEINALARGLISLVTEAARSVCPDIPVGASVGVAYFDQSGPALDHLMARADEAMYRAKRAGKNTVAFSE